MDISKEKKKPKQSRMYSFSNAGKSYRNCHSILEPQKLENMIYAPVFQADINPTSLKHNFAER